MKIKIKMDKKVLAEVPAAYALAGGAAGLIFAPKITLAGIALAAAAGLRPAVEVPPIDAPKPEGFPWLNPAPDVKPRAYYNRIGAELLTGLDGLCEKLSALAK